MKKIFAGKNTTMIVSLLGIYLISAGLSWAIFSYLKGDSPSTAPKQTVTENRRRIDPNLPKTEECPINGAMYSKPEREIWETRRPLTAIIENHEESRPQSGLSFADVVYEAVAEGGITRFLGVFYCGVSAQEVKLAPIRSVRVYFVNWAAEYGKQPIFLHIGGANNICNNCPGGVKPRGQVASEVNAFQMLSDLGWRYSKGNDFDGGTNIGYPIIIRDQFRLGEKAAWEHSVVAFSDKVFDEASERGFGYENEDGEVWIEDFEAWSFKDAAPSSSPEAGEIAFNFWDNKPNYDVKWLYDANENSYKRLNGGNEHKDHETDRQLTAKNVVIQFVRERGPVDEEGHMFYENIDIDQGDALVFQNGEVIEASWEKDGQFDKTVFTDENGDEVEFVRGTIWIEAVPDGNQIDY